MNTQIALIGIIAENRDSIEELNHLLHEYGKDSLLEDRRKGRKIGCGCK